MHEGLLFLAWAMSDTIHLFCTLSIGDSLLGSCLHQDA